MALLSDFQLREEYAATLKQFNALQDILLQILTVRAEEQAAFYPAETAARRLHGLFGRWSDSAALFARAVERNQAALRMVLEPGEADGLTRLVAEHNRLMDELKEAAAEYGTRLSEFWELDKRYHDIFLSPQFKEIQR